RVHSRSNECRLAKSSESGSRPSAIEIPLKCAAYFPPGDCHGSSLISLMFTFFMLLLSFRPEWRNLLLFPLVQFWFHSEITRDVSTEPVLSEVERTRHDNWLLLAVEVIRLLSFHDDFVHALFPDRELAAIGIMTGIAARIIGDHIINEIFPARVAELMRLTRSKEKRVARSADCRSMLVANASASRHNQVKLRLG